MLQGNTVDEIMSKIHKLEREQQEAEHFIRDFQNEEEHDYENIRHELRMLDDEFEECREDAHLTRLLEEERERLCDLERDCGELMSLLTEEQQRMRYQCEGDIDELQREKNRLEMM